MASNPTPMWFNFASAGIAGCGAWVIVHPCNTASIRMNLATASGAASPAFFPFMVKLVKNVGIKSLYDGLLAGLLRQAVYATARVGLFDVLRREVEKRRPIDFLSRLICGCASGGIAALISCPCEVTLVRLSNDSTLPVEKRRNYTGLGNAFVRIFKEEGVTAFFRGSSPFVNRALLVGMVQVGTYDQFKETYAKLGIKGTYSNVMASSMSAGLLYSIVTNPFETAKNRMAFQKADPITGVLPYRSTVQTIAAVARTDGALNLWAGFLPYFLRCGGHTIGMFMGMEWMRKAYNKAYGAGSGAKKL